MNLKVTVVLLLLCATFTHSRRSGGSRGGSSARRTTRRPSQSRNENTVSHARPTTPYRSSNVATQSYGTGNKAAQVTTPRYNIQTHATVRNVPQQAFTQQSIYKPAHNQPTPRPGYNQPGYNQPGYNQPGYNQPGHQQPGYHPPGYNQPGYHPPSYGQPGYSSGYNNQGGWYRKKDHSTRNSVFAGLGGSALGLYLGYKLGSLSNNMHGPFGGGGQMGQSGYPSYSVVHHYHHGDKPIPKEADVETKIIKKCENIGDFCTPNTTPLCLTNGTIYCTAPLDATISCKMNETEYKCINSSLKVPCENSTDVNCTTTSSISIPCVTLINIFGDFSTNTLNIHKISKRSDNDTVTTTEIITTVSNENITTVKVETTTPIVVMDAPSSSITNGGISNKMCVTVIADPVKAPEITEHAKNAEFIDYVASNPAEQEKLDSNANEVLGTILDFLFA